MYADYFPKYRHIENPLVHLFILYVSYTFIAFVNDLRYRVTGFSLFDHATHLWSTECYSEIFR